MIRPVAPIYGENRMKDEDKDITPQDPARRAMLGTSA